MIRKAAIKLLPIAVLAVVGITVFCNCEAKREGSEAKQVLKGVIELDRLADTSQALITGYNYHMLEKFASDHGKTIQIGISSKGKSCLDSLKREAIDILVVPLDEFTQTDSTIASNPVDRQCIWMTSSANTAFLKDINRWLADWEQSEEREQARKDFLVNYNPYRNRPREKMSPYDSLIKAYADSIGWDWRLLGAVIYQESRFHIEAASHRGAGGLMQMMSSTSESLGVEDSFSPEGSIRAGSLYIRKISKRFRRIAADSNELLKFTLAAYNAGETRIQDCINFAAHKGIDSTSWEALTSIIPEMSDNSTVESGVLKCGKFYGTETMKYVEAVLKTYNDFKIIYK